MRLAGMFLVVIAAVLLLHWYRPFEGVCAGVPLVTFLVVWAFLRRRRCRGGDDEGYPNEGSLGREFVFGLFIGVLWLLSASLAVHGLRNTVVHGWFVDEPGATMVHELEVLAHNGAWPSILAQFDHPLPAHVGRVAQATIDRYHYLALANTAVRISDPGARCVAQQLAEAFADKHGVDPVGRLPIVCQAGTSTGNSLAGSNLRQLKQSLDPAGRTVVKVAVSDSFGSPVTGLSQSNFLAIAGNNEVPIVEVTYAPAVSPTQRFIVVIASIKSPAARDLVQAIPGFLNGLIRSTDRIEVMNCCTAGSGLSDVLQDAVVRLRSKPGALILITDGRESPSPESATALLRSLHGHAPMHVLLFGRGAAGKQLESMAEASGGGHWSGVPDDFPALRKSLAAPLAGEGTYFVVLNGKYSGARVTLASPHQSASK